MTFEELVEKAKAMGGEKPYMEYVRSLPCFLTGAYDRKNKTTGEYRSILAHVNRVSRGSGMAVKTPYSYVPTLNEIHDEIMHRYGESKALRETMDLASYHTLLNYVNGVPPITEEEYNKGKRKRVYVVQDEIIAKAIFMVVLRRVKANGSVRMTFEDVSRKRTLEQNNGYWLMVDQFQAYLQANPHYVGDAAYMIADTIIKRALNAGYKEFTHFLFKTCCNGGRSTTDHDTLSFGSELWENMYHLCKEEFDFQLHLPESR